MSSPGAWLFDFANHGNSALVEGLVAVRGYVKAGRDPEEVAIMEKAKNYGADAVFFEASRENGPSVPQAFVYCADGPVDDPDFAKCHQRLWSWGGVPLVYRATRGLVQLFRCAHRPDFEENGRVAFRPFKTLKLASAIAVDPWWDEQRLRNGTLWDDPSVCRKLLSSNQAAQKTLINAIKDLHQKLGANKILTKSLRRRLLILSVLVAYLEARGVFESGFFDRFRPGADKFFHVLADGPALVKLLGQLENRFNGHIFILNDGEREALRDSNQLTRFAELVEGRRESSGQLTLWQRYSFADLPVELISHIYQLFVEDSSLAVYTPHFLVRLMVGEVLSWERLDRLEKRDEVILDGACGSGIFLVEAYRRLVLHWRSRHNWQRPDQTTLHRLLTARIRGVDLEEGAVELAAFSLCLALCDALEPMEIRSSVKLFPQLQEKTIHRSCFFEAWERRTVQGSIGVVIGNPPFASKLATGGAQRAYKRYQENHGALPDRQLAYLFLHESMEMLAPGGAISMLQQYNFLYNQKSLGFRRRFIERWDVREILDFISVRGLFQKGDADTKVIVVVAEAQPPTPRREILHATFRRSGRSDAEQGFDFNYYDMHWLARDLVLNNDGVWRSNLLGGGRVLDFANRLREFRRLGTHAAEQGWDFGEGYIVGKSGNRRPAEHITGQPFFPPEAITSAGLDESRIMVEKSKLFRSSYSRRRFTPPMLLIREQMDLPHTLWTKSYLTYRDQVVGFCAPQTQVADVTRAADWIGSQRLALQAYVAATSTRLFCRKATAISLFDIASLPYPASGTLDLSAHEEILVRDIVDYYRDLVRLGEDSAAMTEPGASALPAFNRVFSSRINGVYKWKKLRALEPQFWAGVICQAYIFGEQKADWSEAAELEGKLDALLREDRGGGLRVTRIVRLYDGACIYLLKPDRLRYWLRSVALRDADETLADLAQQGF